jgi:hypothetical protein
VPYLNGYCSDRFQSRQNRLLSPISIQNQVTAFYFSPAPPWYSVQRYFLTLYSAALNYPPMADIPRRNVRVFSPSDGAPVAGKFHGCIPRAPLFSHLCFTYVSSGFYQHGGVSISTFVSWIREVCYISEAWNIYPCQFNNNRAVGGPALDSNSTLEIQPGRYVIRSPPPSKIFGDSGYTTTDINIVESARVAIFLSSDLARKRAFSVNFTYTPHVRYQSRIVLRLPTNLFRKQIL